MGAPDPRSLADSQRLERLEAAVEALTIGVQAAILMLAAVQARPELPSEVLHALDRRRTRLAAILEEAWRLGSLDD